jgi:nucleoside phosphorylase
VEDHTSPHYGYNYRSMTLRNTKDETLSLHISWLPRYGPQEMTLHLERVLSECRPRIAIMTGICAGDSQQVQLGDLVVAERTFTYDNGKFILDKQGRSVHLHDTMTYQLDANILQFLGLFDEWRPLVESLQRPALEQHEVVCHLKPMASGSAVRADRPFKDIRVPVRGTAAIDMEGAAFGLVMSRHPLIRWLIVKGVCDYADQEKNDDYHVALEQAGAYINDTECGVRRYLKLYEQYRSEIQHLHHGTVPDYPSSVASAWSISRSVVEQSNPAAAELLRLCAFLAPEAIIDELLIKGASALGPVLGPVVANPIALDQAIGLLRKYSLLHREVDRETDLTTPTPKKWERKPSWVGLARPSGLPEPESETPIPTEPALRASSAILPRSSLRVETELCLTYSKKREKEERQSGAQGKPREGKGVAERS